MAQSQTIEKFKFNKATAALDWHLWKKIFNAHVGLLQLRYDVEADEAEIKNALITSIGNHGLETLDALGDRWESLKLAKLIETLDARYQRTTTLTDDMAFENMGMAAGEDLEDYIYRCRSMASMAKISERDVIKKLLKDASIHALPKADKIITMLLDERTTLQAMISWARLNEVKNTIINKSSVVGTSFASLNYVAAPRERIASNNSHKSYGSHSSYGSGSSSSNVKRQYKQTCWHCLRREFPHGSSPCPALSRSCNDCNQAGHFAGSRFCKSPSATKTRGDSKKYVNQILSNLQPNELEMLLNQISLNQNNKKHVVNVGLDSAKLQQVRLINHVSRQRERQCPTQVITVSGEEILFVLDTGAEVNVITMQTYEKFFHKPKLHESRVMLMAFDSDEPITVAGEIKVMVNWQEKVKPVTFIVAENKNADLNNLMCYSTMLDFEVDFNRIFMIQKSRESTTLAKFQPIQQTQRASMNTPKLDIIESQRSIQTYS